MFKTEFVNLHSGEIFRLPTPYSDRVEACVCGQNYCRDRQQEDGTLLFFRVVVDLEKHDDNYYEDDCDGVYELCGLCCEDEDEEDSEESELEQHREDLFQSLLEYCRI